MYIDVLWVMELFCVVFLTSFSLYATYLLPLQYCDLMHRCAVHLGKWDRLDRLTIPTVGNNSNDDSSCYNRNISGSSSSTISSVSSSSAAGEGDGISTQTRNSGPTNNMYAE